jgi:hypothetical protein
LNLLTAYGLNKSGDSAETISIFSEVTVKTGTTELSPHTR